MTRADGSEQSYGPCGAFSRNHLPHAHACFRDEKSFFARNECCFGTTKHLFVANQTSNDGNSSRIATATVLSKRKDGRSSDGFMRQTRSSMYEPLSISSSLSCQAYKGMYITVWDISTKKNCSGGL